MATVFGYYSMWR